MKKFTTWRGWGWVVALTGAALLVLAIYWLVGAVLAEPILRDRLP